MSIRVAINGFGRIGRLVMRNILQNPELEVVHINDLTDPETLAHLFKYDSVQGRYQGDVQVTDAGIVIDGKAIRTSAIADPAQLPWKDSGVQAVIECTGRYTDGAKARLHLAAGAEKVIISAPAKGDIDATVVLGVNDDILRRDMQIVSNASCTTNCLAQMVKVLQDEFGIEQGYMNTIHAYTSDQRLLDAPHSDLRRARAAALNIVPTTTGAAKAIGLVLPALKGKLDGVSMRVPIPAGSVTDFTAVLKKTASAEAINVAMKAASEGKQKGYLEYSEAPLVSSDIVGNPSSCIFDAQSTSSQGTLVKVIGWYDNEWGYSCRTAELVVRLYNA
jgi:glyceraldehyde 3-phosphate dehydrogenase